MYERPILSQTSQIIADETTKPHQPQTVFLCEIMQPAAFPLRDLRNLREIRPFIHIRKEQVKNKEKEWKEQGKKHKNKRKEQASLTDR